MSTTGNNRLPHELFEDRLEKAGWVFRGKGNGDKLNVWGAPHNPEGRDPSIAVPLKPDYSDYDSLLLRAARLFADWQRRRTDADWDSPAPDSAYGELLTEWKDRKRVHGKHEAAHPIRLREALQEAQDAGLHLAADAIQSLVFEATVTSNREQHLIEQIQELKAQNEDLRTEGNGWFSALNKVEGEVVEWAAAYLEYTAALDENPDLPESDPATKRLRAAEVILRKRAKLEGET